jgi:hypothetical protein
MKHVRFGRFIAFLAVTAFVLSQAPLSTSAAPRTTSASARRQAQAQPTSYRTIYQAIVDEYSAKLRAETPVLISEFYKEAAYVYDIETLAELANSKVEIHAKIFNEGCYEMIVRLKNYPRLDEYDRWYIKLRKVYEDEAGEIYDACHEEARRFH